ncbi:BREX system ATP-binding protein BrxD [bacterium]|nr:BREX system ATP-binding protein BrxD [bacterium]
MQRDIKVIFESLRRGTVPERGLHHFEVGTEKTRGELRRQLDLAESGEGAFKFLRGGYGCGKTFSARLAINEALERNFAASFVVVSDNDLRFYKFEELYRKVMSQLSTASCDRAALGNILDRWIGKVEDSLTDLGEDEDDPGFDQKVLKKIEEDLHNNTGGTVPQDMIRVLQKYFALKQERNLSDAGALLSWLCGGEGVSASIKNKAGIKGDIGSDQALDYLRGVLEIVKASGHKGLVIVIDEAETILRSRNDTRGKSLNGIRQILDDSERFRGLLWIFTGTPEFFDTQRGVKGLQPLHDRIRFNKSGNFVNYMQPQLELTPFDADRLRQVARNLRSIYPESQEQIREKVNDAFIDALVQKFMQGFAAQVGIVPRLFLRKFVDILDLVHQHPEYRPDVAEDVELSEEERAILNAPPLPTEAGDEAGYEEVTF